MYWLNIASDFGGIPQIIPLETPCIARKGEIDTCTIISVFHFNAEYWEYMYILLIIFCTERIPNNIKYSESWNTHLKVYTHCKFLDIVLFVSKQGGGDNPHSPSISIWPRTVKLFRCWFVRVTVFCIPQLGEDSDNTPTISSAGVGKILLRKPSQLVKSYIIFDYLHSAPSTVNVV